MLHYSFIVNIYLDAHIKNTRKKKTDQQNSGLLMLSSLQVGKTPKPEMKRILEEINAIKTKVTMFSVWFVGLFVCF